jgi:inner membrane protein YidH
MVDESVGEQSARFDVRVTAESHFSWLRTRLSIERTLMAWLRTAVSLIGFGFAIVQFYDRLEAMPGTNPARFPGAARYLGLSLIFCGIVALVIAIWQYRWILNYLWSEPFSAVAGITKGEMQTPVLATSIVLILVGTFAFFSVLFRLV